MVFQAAFLGLAAFDVGGEHFHAGVLGSVAQGVVDEDEGDHGFGDGGGAQADAGVVAAVGGDGYGFALDVDAAAGGGDGAGGLHGKFSAEGLAGGDAAEDAAGVVGGEALRGEFVAVEAAALGYDVEAVADGHGFDGVDGHQGAGDVGIQPVEHGFAPADGHVARFYGEARADGVEVFAHAVHVVFEFGDLRVVGGEEGVAGDVFVALEGDFFLADLGYVGDDVDGKLLAQPFFCHCAGGDAGGSFAGGASAAAPVVADAVFVPVGVVGVAGAELAGDCTVVFAALVGVADEEGDGGAGGCAFKHAGEDFHLVGFAALGNVAAGAGFAAVEVGLDVGFAEGEAGRAAVDDAADARAVAFAEGGNGEELSEGVACHVLLLCGGVRQRQISGF